MSNGILVPLRQAQFERLRARAYICRNIFGWINQFKYSTSETTNSISVLLRFVELIDIIVVAVII